MGGDDNRLWRALFNKLSAPTQINPVHLNKPPTYDGKELAKFRSWWMKVESYMETYAESFPQDLHKINWVGSLLTDKAQLWHQQRALQVNRMGLTDNWNGYVVALRERFRDPSERHRNSRKMAELRYHNDISQYLTELMDLNEVVQWSGTTFQNHIAKALPDEIVKLVYSRHGGLPDTDEEFLSAVQEAGLIYENMLSNPGLESVGKGAPGSTSERSKPVPPPAKEPRSLSGHNQSSRKEAGKTTGGSKVDPKSKRWSNNRDALKGIDQADIDKRKSANKACWRCGRDNHGTLDCFAKKDVNGKDLPPAPERTSAIKRKNDAEEIPPPKKVRIDAITLPTPPFELGHIIEEPSDSDSDF
jgi:hypothetical protein